MQIVINIPKEFIKVLNDIKDESFINQEIYKVISNGTILPEEHGRLIDADALWKKWVFDAIGKQEIDDAPTIIEADKLEREDKNKENENFNDLSTN